MDQGESSKWVAAYQEDPKLQMALKELQQGRPFGDLQLTPRVLIIVHQDGQQKIVVPLSL